MGGGIAIRCHSQQWGMGRTKMLAHWNQALYMYGQPAAAEQGLGPQVLFRLPPSGEGSPSVTINSALMLSWKSCTGPGEKELAAQARTQVLLGGSQCQR